jgi:hypothetical protein
MTDMLRYRWTSFGPMLDEDGPFVTYADHLEALRQASALATPETVAQANYWYEEGVRDALNGAVQRVEALPHSLECVTRDPNYKRPCNCLRSDALDAIKGDQ